MNNHAEFIGRCPDCASLDVVAGCTIYYDGHSDEITMYWGFHCNSCEFRSANRLDMKKWIKNHPAGQKSRMYTPFEEDWETR